MCLELSSRQGNPGGCDSVSGEEVAMTWTGVVGPEGKHWIRDTLYTLPGPHGHSYGHPRSWGTLSL